MLLVFDKVWPWVVQKVDNTIRRDESLSSR